jgi:ribosomal protein L14E/L6E/L27E
MLRNAEIFEFFQDFPKHLLSKAIEEVLIFGIRMMKEKLKNRVNILKVLNINQSSKSPEVKNKPKVFEPLKKKDLVQDTDRMRLVTCRETKENPPLDTTSLPLKIDARRTQSNQFFASTQASVKESPRLSESIEKDLEVMRIADEFLKNPFARVEKKPTRKNSVVFIDSHLYSTIEISSPTPTWTSEMPD